MFQQLKLILLLLIGIFFLVIGIHLLIAAYQLDNPFAFIVTFFASNLMILISATLSLGFALRLIRYYRKPAADKTPPPDQER